MSHFVVDIWPIYVTDDTLQESHHRSSLGLKLLLTGQPSRENLSLSLSVIVCNSLRVGC